MSDNSHLKGMVAPMRKGLGFRHAIRGFIVAVGQELNMKVHVFAVVVVTMAGILGSLERWAWAAVIISYALVIVSELFNTAIERICDKITNEICPTIKDIKDIAASAVFFSALISVGVAALVFARHEVWEQWMRFFV